MDVELREIRDFLAEHSPFAELPESELDALPARLQLRYFRRGTALLTVGQPNHALYIIRSGAADIVDAGGQLVERVEPGGSFGASSLLSRAPSRYTIATIEDSLVLVAPADLVVDLNERHQAVREFYDEVSTQRLRTAATTVASAGPGAAWLRTPLSEVNAGRGIVHTGPTATIREAAVQMSQERVSALLVLTDERLVGIFTDRDLRKVVASGTDTSLPLSTVMTSQPRSISPDALAFEALLEMTSSGVHHLPIVEPCAGGVRPVGLVTQGDLLRLEKTNPVFLVRDIARRTSVAEVAAVTAQAPQLVRQLLGQDAAADDITRLLTAIADAAANRLIQLGSLDLAERGLGDDPGGWCWLALGSQARRELGPSSDQDHAIMHSDGLDQRALDWLAALADFVTSGLVDCGYRLCEGDVMASNPKWRTSVSGWRTLFAGWLSEPQPEAVLHAQIFFDARVVHGDHALFEGLHADVLAAAPRSQRFLAHLATQAVERQPPLGFFRGFVLAKQGEHRNELDIKSGGVHAVIELTRVHALAHGLPEVGTIERLNELARRGVVNQQTRDDLVDAFEFCNHVRLSHQARQLERGERVDNFINPDELTSFDKRHLRDAFGVIRKAQEGLGYAYQTHLMR